MTTQWLRTCSPQTRGMLDFLFSTPMGRAYAHRMLSIAKASNLEENFQHDFTTLKPPPALQKFVTLCSMWKRDASYRHKSGKYSKKIAKIAVFVLL